MLKVGQNPTNVRHSKKKRVCKKSNAESCIFTNGFEHSPKYNKRNVLHTQHKHLSKIHLLICISFTFFNYNKIFVYLTLITILYYGFYI